MKNMKVRKNFEIHTGGYSRVTNVGQQTSMGWDVCFWYQLS